MKSYYISNSLAGAEAPVFLDELLCKYIAATPFKSLSEAVTVSFAYLHGPMYQSQLSRRVNNISDTRMAFVALSLRHNLRIGKCFKMIIWMVFLLFIGSPKASRVLLFGEKAETQLVALFEEATSSDFQVSTGKNLYLKILISRFRSISDF